MSVCTKCKVTFDRGKKEGMKINCNLCEKVFHPSCVDMTKAVCEFIINSSNTNWFCDDCAENNVIKNMMHKILSLEKRINENSVKLNKIENNKQINSNGATVLNSPQPRSRLADVLSGIMDGATPPSKTTRRDRTNAEYKVNEEPVLVVNSTDETEKKSLLQAVKSNLNPLHDPVTKVRCTASGKVIVHCSSKDAIDSVKKKIADAMKQNVVVSEPKALQPRIRVLAVDAAYVNESTVAKDDERKMIVGENAELINMIRKQNENLIGESSKLNVTEVKKRKDGKYNVIMSCDLNTLNKIVQSPKLRIGWDICFVHEYLNLFRCYHCNQYSDHEAASCPLKDEDPVCPRCSERHSLESCKVKDRKDLCCINCKNFNARNRINNPTDHTVWSERCPILQRKFKQRREKLRYAS